jgi:hypothetical protein
LLYDRLFIGSESFLPVKHFLSRKLLEFLSLLDQGVENEDKKEAEKVIPTLYTYTSIFSSVFF